MTLRECVVDCSISVPYVKDRIWKRITGIHIPSRQVFGFVMPMPLAEIGKYKISIGHWYPALFWTDVKGFEW